MALASDGGRCIDTLRSHTGLASRRTKSEKRLDGVRAAFGKFDTIINEISSNTPDVREKNRSLAVFCAGSLGRMEASDKSDLDLFVTANDDGQSCGHLFRIGLFSELMKINRKLNFPPFSNDGEYLRIHGMEELKSGTGSRFEDSENLFTARMLLILESRPVANDSIYRKHRHGILEFYYRDRTGVRPFRPVFILNDLLRYWRTVCLNYEERRHDANRRFREKNVNLRFSRMLTVFGTVLPLVAKPIGTDVDLDKLCEKTPLERLATGLDWLGDSGLTARWSGILDGYAEFLTWKENPDVETFLTENKGLVNKRAEELSAFLYDALTHKTIQPELRRTLIL